MNGEQWPTASPAGAHSCAELGGLGDPMRPRQHESGDERQTASLERPLARRDDKIARPARVRMRSRKPCTFARRRLFGWYVRLLMGLPLVSRPGTSPEPWLKSVVTAVTNDLPATAKRYALPLRWVKLPKASTDTPSGRGQQLSTLWIKVAARCATV